MVTSLHIAAQARDSSVLEYLLAEGLQSNIDAQADTGITPLIAAVWAKRPRNVSLLLSNGANIGVIDVLGYTPIHLAAKHGHEEVVAIFIEHGSDLGLLDSVGLTPELVARKCGHTTLANVIKNYVNEQNDKPNALPHSQVQGKSHGSLEALQVAIDVGDLELCTRLVENGTDLNSGFGWCKGCTPLLYSLVKGEIAISEFLVSQGASIAGRTCELWSTRGFTAFHYAAVWGSTMLLRLLLEKAPSEIHVSPDPIHPIHLAVLKNNSDCVELILYHARQGRGAVLSDPLNTPREALSRLVNMQVRDDMLHWSWCAAPGELFPETLRTAKPLHIAASKGHSRIVQILLEHGTSIDSVDGKHATPLHYAAENGQAGMVKLLLDYAANPNAVDISLQSPCMIAAAHADVNLLQTLMKGGADIQLRSWCGQTALNCAANSRTKDAFVFLMNATTGQGLGAGDELGLKVLYEAMCCRWDLPITYFLNLAPLAGIYESQSYNIINAAVAYRSTTEFRMLLRRLPTGLSPSLLDYRALIEGTPLHLAAALSKVDTLNLLLDAGAQLELDGSEHGTPLMGACATGRLAAVKLLVARGAKTSYVRDGQFFSAFAAAKYHPEVRRWLLVGRFLEGPKLLAYKEVE